MIGVAKVLSAVLLAGTVHGHAPARTELTLSIRDGAGAYGPVVGRTTLTCAPQGGAHPEAAAACRALDAAGGDLNRLRGRKGVCTMIYRQVTAVAYGHRGARPVRFTKTYDNACRLKSALAPVYDFTAGPAAQA